MALRAEAARAVVYAYSYFAKYLHPTVLVECFSLISELKWSRRFLRTVDAPAEYQLLFLTATRNEKEKKAALVFGSLQSNMSNSIGWAYQSRSDP